MNDNKLEIIPGILEKNWSEIEKKLKQIKTFAKSAHIDIIDGEFVNNKTFLDPKPFKEFSDDIFLEVHLMVDNPEKYLKPFSDSGFKRFLGHVEKMPNIVNFVAQGQMLGEVGLAIDGPTNIHVLKNINLDDLDCLLIYLSEKVGFAGPPMLNNRLEKVKELRSKSNIPIEVDGGVKDDNLSKVIDSGATRFVATSFIWKDNNPKEAYNKLKALL